MYRVTPIRLVRALARDGLCVVLRAVLKAIEVAPPPPPRPPTEWSITVYGEDGDAPVRVLSRRP